MVDRELPLSGRVPLHLERPPAFVVVALRHLTAQLDNLSDCDHLPNDATGDTEPFEFSDQAFRLVPWSIGHRNLLPTGVLENSRCFRLGPLVPRMNSPPNGSELKSELSRGPKIEQGGCSRRTPGNPVNIPHDIENRGVATGINQKLNPEVSGGIRPSPQVTKSVRLNLSRWRHGFEPRWDYEHKGPGQGTSLDESGG